MGEYVEGLWRCIMNFLDKYKVENEKRMSIYTQKQKRILAAMCLERQFYAYRQLAKGKIWARSEQYRELLDFILVYLNEDEGELFEYDKFENHPLIVNELNKQIEDEINMKKIIKLENAKNWYNQCEGIF